MHLSSHFILDHLILIHFAFEIYVFMLVTMWQVLWSYSRNNCYVSKSETYETYFSWKVYLVGS